MQPKFTLILFILCIAMCSTTVAQRVRKNVPLQNVEPASQQTDSRGNPINPARKGDTTLKHRDNTEDSITIFYRFLDSTRTHSLDSSLTDFNKRFVTPYDYYNIGNLGSPAKSYVFRPILQPGFDVGFHSMDIYKFKVEDTKIYQTTRPYTQIAYILGSKAEQTAHLTFTQNRKDNVNYGFEYRFINGPGNMRSQNSSHNNFRFHLYYQSRNRKYTAYAIYVGNKLKASVNGGLRDKAQLNSDSLSFNDPFELETRLGSGSGTNRNPFNTFIATGNEFKDNTIFFRHHFDIGTRDSLVTDSVTLRLFYPRFRLQHTLSYRTQSYAYNDVQPDTADYKNFFAYNLINDTIAIKDRWRVLSNEFSIISFPEKNNLNQFIKLGAAIENIFGNYANSLNYKVTDYNIYLLGEYRNRTRNKVWDIEANGRLYVVGRNNSDYTAYVRLQRLLGRSNYLSAGFQNVNRSVSEVYNRNTGFPVYALTNANKENTTKIFASVGNAKLRLNLYGEYMLLSNYTYFTDFYKAQQAGKVFHMLHVFADKQFKISRRLTVYTEAHVQQTTKDAPVHVPLFFTRNRLVHEANYYRNLFLAFGTEVKYNTPFRADNYSPVNAQFNLQDSITISNLPQVDVFVNFRIKTFKAFIRYDNLNSFIKKHSYSAPLYLNPQGIFRLGIFWDFVN